MQDKLLMMLVWSSSYLVAAEGYLVDPMRSSVATSHVGNLAYRPGPDYHQIVPAYRPDISQRNVRRYQPVIIRGRDDAQFLSTVHVDRDDRLNNRGKHVFAVPVDPRQVSRDQADESTIVRPKERVVEPRIMPDFQQMHRILKMAIHEKETYDLLKQICNINELLQLTDEIIQAERYPDDFVTRVQDLLRNQKTVADITIILIHNNVSLKTKQDLLKLAQTYADVLTRLQQRDRVVDQFVEKVAHELPVRSASLMLDSAIQQQSKVELSNDTHDTIVTTMLVLYGLSTVAALILAIVGSKTHNVTLEDAAAVIFVCDVVIGMIMICSGAPNLCRLMDAMGSAVR